MNEFEALPIDAKMIQRYIQHNKAEYDEVLSEDQARDDLVHLKSKGCLLYEDCRSCPKFGKCCPI